MIIQRTEREIHLYTIQKSFTCSLKCTNRNQWVHQLRQVFSLTFLASQLRQLDPNRTLFCCKYFSLTLRGPQGSQVWTRPKLICLPGPWNKTKSCEIKVIWSVKLFYSLRIIIMKGHFDYKFQIFTLWDLWSDISHRHVFHRGRGHTPGSRDRWVASAHPSSDGLSLAQEAGLLLRSLDIFEHVDSQPLWWFSKILKFY